ncbi:protein of unknown function (plasmid) [Cupriavidus taiwanensis]|uniref:Uncharacterized protein n=1 Tax=Cupriavidus taiwanensis TaxID=164546 RepID=A0A375EDX7_9BURK|nr:protein of unknown function [Cupriavidus taiwanensis]SOZ74446.1 protein of unknown function [Cupriavidus taiwanensis]
MTPGASTLILTNTSVTGICFDYHSRRAESLMRLKWDVLLGHSRRNLWTTATGSQS